MKDRQREKVRERLLQERRQTLESLAEFDDRFRERLEQGDDDLSKYTQHMADEGTETMEQEKEFLLASQEGRQLLDIDEALRTLYKEPERFGTCERCGREIGMERLDMVPWARLCIDCKNAVEAGEGATAA
ncbi:MAG TPA: TraR/DksA C4-type zinc finger protein [Longimicrobiales bacterium]|nr:TraR/DksA C4-type zinc finger protein [Longimicrobiales bacterium]